ncbi:MAG: thiamine phosphate synthase [Hyphomonadaceae bacterium]|nr:thiamine phosphate synthase [Hyphomonadaceae bacterium]
MRSVHALAALARQLNRSAGAPPVPALYFMTDPARTPDPATIARRLPRGTAIVYRHFGAADRRRTARNLAALARDRGLILLIAADADLAAKVGAGGVHWPQRLLWRAERFGVTTVSAHNIGDVAHAERFGADAVILGPVFQTASASGNPPLGLFRASQLARKSPLPVIALGGVNARSSTHLAGRGFSGFAAVDAFKNQTA